MTFDNISNQFKQIQTQTQISHLEFKLNSSKSKFSVQLKSSPKCEANGVVLALKQKLHIELHLKLIFIDKWIIELARQLS